MTDHPGDPRAAGMAKYGDELKELVRLYKVDPDGFDKKLEGMFSAEEAAKG